jgi:hypothetical protein
MTFFSHVNRYGILVLVSCIIIAAIITAPGYLLYEKDKPATARCIVLLVGPENDLREEKALELMHERRTRYLLIPAKQTLKTLLNNGAVIPVKSPSINYPSVYELKNLKKYSFYEQTHLEIMLAKRAIDSLGFRSVTFVSSPYHMRRVSMIAESIFNADTYSLSYAAGHPQPRHNEAWMFGIHDLTWVTSEYMKIGWFLTYNIFQQS